MVFTGGLTASQYESGGFNFRKVNVDYPLLDAVDSKYMIKCLISS